MHPIAELRTWVDRAWRLGPSRLALAFSVLLALLALALPFWSLGDATGNVRDVTSFSWTTMASDRYQGGAWTRTTIVPYASSGFGAVAGVLGISYILDALFILLAVVVFALFSLSIGRNMPTLGLLVISLLVVGVGLLAIFYPIVAIPGAATTDLGTFTVSGFWGSTNTGPTQVSWGAGAGWWLLLASVVLGIVGAGIPYLKSVRAMAPSRPQVERPSM